VWDMVREACTSHRFLPPFLCLLFGGPGRECDLFLLPLLLHSPLLCFSSTFACSADRTRKRRRKGRDTWTTPTATAAAGREGGRERAAAAAAAADVFFSPLE